MRSRRRSAWPLWRAYSSTMWMSTQRSEIGPRQESLPVTSRSGASARNWSANAVSARQARHASATTSGSGTAPSKSPSGSALVEKCGGAAAQLLGVQAGALQLQGEALAAQEVGQHGALVADGRAALAGIVLQVDEHVGSSAHG